MSQHFSMGRRYRKPHGRSNTNSCGISSSFGWRGMQSPLYHCHYGGLPSLTPETAVTLTAFVESVYFPHSEQRTRPSTYGGYKVLWREIKPFCEGLWTRDVRTRHVQAILEAMAKTDRFNVNSLKHIKSFLSGIFRLAAQQGYYEGANPVRETSLPQV